MAQATSKHKGARHGTERAFKRQILGGAEEARTPDLRIANATLSQLSYRPTSLQY
jgi:hypothetical protein